MKSMKLSSSYGMNIVLANDYKTAMKKEGKFNRATVCSKESLDPGQPFQVLLFSCEALFVITLCSLSLRLLMAVTMTGMCSLDSRLSPLTEQLDMSMLANIYKSRALSWLQTLLVVLGFS